MPPNRALELTSQSPLLSSRLETRAEVEGESEGRLGGSAVECLPSAQDVILESWDQVPHQAPCEEPASPSAYVSASLS